MSTENKNRNGLTAQSRRMLEYALTKPNTDIPAPELNAAAAGEGRSYVASFSRRTHEVRQEMQRRGGDFILSVDKWVNGQRQTEYRLTPAPVKPPIPPTLTPAFEQPVNFSGELNLEAK